MSEINYGRFSLQQQQEIASPAGWIADYVRRYLATDGADGHEWNGAPVLVLTTTGGSSSRPRRTPLIYGQSKDSYVVVAANGGSDEHPVWYSNLESNLHVQVQVRGNRFAVRARTAGPAEKPDLWAKMTTIWPEFDSSQTRTDREFPVVVLENLALHGTPQT